MAPAQASVDGRLLSPRLYAQERIRGWSRVIESFGGITRVRRTVAAFADWHTGPGISPSRVGGNLHGRDTWFCLFEGVTYPAILDVACSGYASNTGIEAVDSLLSKGGFTSMLYAISIVICAMMCGTNSGCTMSKPSPAASHWPDWERVLSARPHVCIGSFPMQCWSAGFRGGDSRQAPGATRRIRGKWFDLSRPTAFSHDRWGRSAGRPVGRRRQA